MNTINFIELIERNPITRLNKDYQNTLISKIEKSFTETQQQLFLASFFCYLNHDNKKDFIIDFDDVWKWTGFSRKGDAKRMLEKNFVIDIDYQVKKATMATTPAALQVGEAVFDTLNGGQNKEIILLTVNTFKKFCLKADTKKADEIHDYYIKLEELIQETIAEENTIIKNQLTKIEEQFINTKEEYNKLQENHKRILYKRRVHKLRKGKCFYILENTNVKNEKKIGTSINLNSRKSGYNTYFDPNFLYILFTPHFKLIETLVKVKFKNSIKENSDEWIVDIPENNIISFVENMCKELEIEYETFTKLEDIIVDSKKDFSSDNEEVGDVVDNVEEDDVVEEEIHEEEIKEDEDVDSVEIIYTKEITKKCTKCLNSKIYSDFSKDKTKKDGLHTTCKKCEKESKKLYKESKMKKIKEDKIQEKECTKCKTIQSISEFTVHLYTKDGYCANCKSCSRLETNSKRKVNKENNVSYSCEICNKSYSRIDTFNRHKKSCSN